MSENKVRSLVPEGWNPHLGYTGDVDVVAGLDIAIETGSFAVIVGPDAYGESTLLRPLSKVLSPRSGTVLLNGREITGICPKIFVWGVGFLTQFSIAPEGITVHELVDRGRYPYQGMLHQWSDENNEQVSTAMEHINVSALAV